MNRILEVSLLNMDAFKIIEPNPGPGIYKMAGSPLSS